MLQVNESRLNTIEYRLRSDEQNRQLGESSTRMDVAIQELEEVNRLLQAELAARAKLDGTAEGSAGEEGWDGQVEGLKAMGWAIGRCGEV
jgi:hypothetical protein